MIAPAPTQNTDSVLTPSYSREYVGVAQRCSERNSRTAVAAADVTWGSPSATRHKADPPRTASSG
jgi:hypothetical protein